VVVLESVGLVLVLHEKADASSAAPHASRRIR
jgi:hypothetical protein